MSETDQFRPIQLADKATFDTFFAQDPPETSELTFTNLFMWRKRYRPMWKIRENCLLIVFQEHREALSGLPPVGPGDKRDALHYLVQYLKSLSLGARISRVGQSFVEKHVDANTYKIVEDRDNSDYVYLAQNLIELPGNRFHRKKNLVNQFKKKYHFEYVKLSSQLVDSFLELQENWCELKDCDSDKDLGHEDQAVYEALKHYDSLGYQGGAVLIDGEVAAFSLGEMLNHGTAVIHIEKADPSVTGLYAAINNMFCRNAWSQVKYINREQDLGVEGLRKAKESYYPVYLVHKYTLLA